MKIIRNRKNQIIEPNIKGKLKKNVFFFKYVKY